MQHDKIIKDERGTIRINVRLWMDSYGRKDASGNSFRYDVIVWHTAPKKRTGHVNEGIVTPAEILAAKEEFWKLLNPSK